MADCIRDGERLIIGDASLAAPQARIVSGAQGASPLLIGAVLPLVIVLLLDPAGLRPARFLIGLALVALLLASVGLFIASVVEPTEVATVILDPHLRRVEIVATGRFAISRRSLPFDDVARLGRAKAYDHDGYQVAGVRMTLRDGSHIELPAGTGDMHIMAMQVVLGRKPTLRA